MRQSWLSFLNWSVRVGRLFGIPIDLHITLLFFLWPVLSRSRIDVWHGLEIALLVVLSILLHELGHALTAKRYKLQGLSITLHGFGGFAVSQGARTPVQDLWIVLAGPAVTFALSLLFYGISALGLASGNLGEEAYVQFQILGYLGWLNLILGFLNLLPSLPFDGGLALKALLWRKMPEGKAARAVAHLGLILTPLLFVGGLLSKVPLLPVFAIIGFIANLMALLNSGGVRFGEFFADRKARRELEEVQARERARHDHFLDEVRAREKEREEKERLRRLLESSPDE